MTKYTEYIAKRKTDYHLCGEINNGVYRVSCVLRRGHKGLHIHDGRLTGQTVFGYKKEGN